MYKNILLGEYGTDSICIQNNPTFFISGSWAHTTFSRRFQTLLSQGDFGRTWGLHYFCRFFGSLRHARLTATKLVFWT